MTLACSNLDLWCSVFFAVSECLGVKRTLSGTLRLVYIYISIDIYIYICVKTKVPGPWDEQLQE